MALSCHQNTMLPDAHGPVPSILNLPNELFLEIFSYFSLESPIDLHQLLILRRVSRALELIISSCLHGKLTFHVAPMTLAGLQRMISFVESETDHYKACFGRLILSSNMASDEKSSNTLTPKGFQILATVTEKAFAYFLVSIPFLESIGQYIRRLDVGGGSRSALRSVRLNAVSLDRFYRATAMGLLHASGGVTGGKNYLPNLRSLQIVMKSSALIEYLTGCFMDTRITNIVNTYRASYTSSRQYFNYVATYRCSQIPAYFTITKEQLTLWREATGYNVRKYTVPPIPILVQINELQITDPRMVNACNCPLDIFRFLSYVERFRSVPLEVVKVKKPEGPLDREARQLMDGFFLDRASSAREYQMGDADIPHPDAPWLQGND